MREEYKPQGSNNLVSYRKYSVIVGLLAVKRTTSAAEGRIMLSILQCSIRQHKNTLDVIYYNLTHEKSKTNPLHSHIIHTL